MVTEMRWHTWFSDWGLLVMCYDTNWVLENSRVYLYKHTCICCMH